MTTNQVTLIEFDQGRSHATLVEPHSIKFDQDEWLLTVEDLATATHRDIKMSRVLGLDQEVLLDPKTPAPACDMYMQFYSTRKFHGSNDNLWQQLLDVLRRIDDGSVPPVLPALASFLWASLPYLDKPERQGPSPKEAVSFVYTNYIGETRWRNVVPIEIRFTSTEWHPIKQWHLIALDLDRDQYRSFAVSDIKTPFFKSTPLMRGVYTSASHTGGD